MSKVHLAPQRQASREGGLFAPVKGQVGFVCVVRGVTSFLLWGSALSILKAFKTYFLSIYMKD